MYLYLFALIVGGVLLGASILLGGHAGETHAPDAAHDHAGESNGAAWGGFLVAFASLRFWTFFLAFFGLTGLALDGLDLVSNEWLTLALSVVMGGATGSGAVALLRKLTSDTTGKATDSGDFVGKTARVLVPIDHGSTGKVRVEIKGNSIDLLATADDSDSFAGKEEVLIVEMEGNRARVTRVER